MGRVLPTVSPRRRILRYQPETCIVVAARHNKKGIIMSVDLGPFAELEEMTIAELQAAQAAGRYTARQLVEMYLARIQALDAGGPTLRSVIETNPEALEIAAALDRERATSGPRGPLHGIP